MSKNISISVLAIAFMIFACSEEPGKLRLSIDDTQLSIKSDPDSPYGRCDSTCVNITFSLINSTNNTLLLYAFNDEILFSVDSLPANCDSTNYTLDNSVLLSLFSESGEFIGFADFTRAFGECIDWERAHNPDLIFRKGSVLIGPGQHLQFVDRVNFQGYRLRTPGKFRIELFYRQVRRSLLDKVLGAEQVRADLARNNAVLFEGCIRSNPVTLIVD